MNRSIIRLHAWLVALFACCVVASPRAGADERILDFHSDIAVDADEVTLQSEEIVARLEVRIALLHGEDALHLLRQLALEPRLVLQRGGGHRARTQFRHENQRGALVGGVALHRGDQLRHQVVPARELHVDVAPCRAHLVARSDEVVEHDHDGRDDEECDRADPPPEHADSPPEPTPRPARIIGHLCMYARRADGVCATMRA